MKELLISLQPDEGPALYEQIYQTLRNEIEGGRIPCGERLPSTRLMAKNLSVSRSTVELAYDQLTSEGYIEPKAGSGFFVCDLSNLYTLPAPRETKEREPETDGQAKTLPFDFSPYDIDAEHFPFQIWKKINKEVLVDEELLSSGDSLGDIRFRRILCDYLYHARNVDCTPEQMIIGAGNEYLLLILMQLFGNLGKVAMERPTYMKAYQVLDQTGVELVTVAMDEDGICVEDLERTGANLVYVMPSHQFPLGTVMPLRRRQELLAWAGKGEDRYIIEDDHDSEFRYIGKPIPALQSRDADGRVIYLGTFSKSIAPSLRMSYMVLPPKLAKRYQEKLGFYSSTVAATQQRLVCRFMEEGHFERHLNRMRGVYKAKRDFLLHLLKGKKWIHTILGDNAGLHLVIELNTALTEQELLEKAEKKGIRLYGTNDYFTEGDSCFSRVTILLGYGGLSMDVLEEGIGRLDRLLSQYISNADVHSMASVAGVGKELRKKA